MLFHLSSSRTKPKKKFDENNNAFNADVKDEKIDVEMTK